MIPTLIRHAPGCTQSRVAKLADSQPDGVGVLVFECPECKAFASSPRSA